MGKDFKNRKVHKVGWAKKLGGFADLSQELHNLGFEYQYKAGQPSYSDTGIARYLDRSGKKATLKRVERGAAGHFTGAKVGIVYISQQPDLWALVGKSEGRLAHEKELRRQRRR